jgi:mRNA interferase RelE/StbE
VKKLGGKADYFRIRVGEYRVLYRIEGKRVTVVVVKIGHRRDVYR